MYGLCSQAGHLDVEVDDRRMSVGHNERTEAPLTWPPRNLLPKPSTSTKRWLIVMPEAQYGLYEFGRS